MSKAGLVLGAAALLSAGWLLKAYYFSDDDPPPKSPLLRPKENGEGVKAPRRIASYGVIPMTTLPEDSEEEEEADEQKLEVGGTGLSPADVVLSETEHSHSIHNGHSNDHRSPDQQRVAGAVGENIPEGTGPQQMQVVQHATEGKQGNQQRGQQPQDGEQKSAAQPPSPQTEAVGEVQEPVERRLFVLRGVSGSGKSFLAAQLLRDFSQGCQEDQCGGVVLSSDDFFIKEGEYVFDAKQLQRAHSWNQIRARIAMQNGVNPVIIDNTHTQKWEARPYVEAALEFGYAVYFREPDTAWRHNPHELAKRNQHGVPVSAIQRMLSRWENDFTVDNVLKAEPPRRARRQPRRTANNRQDQDHQPA